MSLSEYFNQHPVAKKLGVGLTLAVALVGCESDQDIAEKPLVVQDMVTQSLKICEAGAINPEPAQYSERLSSALMDVRASTLKSIQNNGIIVCLDQRLPSVFDSKLQGIFYNSGNSPIISVSDNGTQPPKEAGWYNRPTREASQALAELPDLKTMESGTFYAQEEVRHRYCGPRHMRCIAHVTAWKDSAHADQDTIAKNPQLKTPLLKQGINAPQS
jgi:hypothetical protein